MLTNYIKHTYRKIHIKPMKASQGVRGGLLWKGSNSKNKQRSQTGVSLSNHIRNKKIPG